MTQNSRYWGWWPGEGQVGAADQGSPHSQEGRLGEGNTSPKTWLLEWRLDGADPGCHQGLQS